VQPVKQIACDLVDRLRDVARDLGCESDLMYVKEIARGQGWAERQRGVLESTGSPMAIVETLSSQARVSDYDVIVK
jgi:gamma-glutamyl:cysteine ligase YbdK (ATP-grasp superfamily)